MPNKRAASGTVNTNDTSASCTHYLHLVSSGTKEWRAGKAKRVKKSLPMRHAHRYEVSRPRSFRVVSSPADLGDAGAHSRNRRLPRPEGLGRGRDEDGTDGPLAYRRLLHARSAAKICTQRIILKS
jgi:hypothetical protein